MSKPPVNFRINIAGFAGSAITLFAAYSFDKDLLLVAKEAPEYEGGARDGFLKITNQARDGAYDALFNADVEMADAIKSFFDFEGMHRLTLSQAVQRHGPGTKIERDGFSDTGQKYRIAPDMSCGQVAVMVACLMADRQRGVAAAESFAMDMLIIGGDEPERGPLRDWRLVEP